ncbi:hypothetical protein ACFC0S_18800 [Streptomyces sp. NPDC056084]|uniref:hypothetical protein n=1 Tax=unclassified Streptomyces TaxID=2593676 RepID=UPI0035DA494D
MKAVEMKIVADGQTITDFDIVTRNAVIQVKTGAAKGSLKDHLRYESATDYPVISFIQPGKRYPKHAIQELERAGKMVTTDLDELLAVIAP